MNIFVGNLSRDATEQDIRQAFEAFGAVSSAAVIKDRMTQESRGFGFIEMPNTSEAQAAIQALNGSDIKGRRINVNEARPREERSDRSGFGGGGGRGGFGGGGGGGGRRFDDRGDRNAFRGDRRGGSSPRRNDRKPSW